LPESNFLKVGSKERNNYSRAVFSGRVGHS